MRGRESERGIERERESARARERVRAEFLFCLLVDSDPDREDVIGMQDK